MIDKLKDRIVVRNANFKELKLIGDITDLLKKYHGWYLVGFVVDGHSFSRLTVLAQPQVFIEDGRVKILFEGNGNFIPPKETGPWEKLLDKYKLTIVLKGRAN